MQIKTEIEKIADAAGFSAYGYVRVDTLKYYRAVRGLILYTGWLYCFGLCIDDFFSCSRIWRFQGKPSSVRIPFRRQRDAHRLFYAFIC